MVRKKRVANGLMGGYVADAAALGFHWLYDPDRIAKLAGESPAFRTPDASDFEGYKGVFVHAGRRAGDASQYGAQLRVAVQSMAATDGRFDITDFQNRFAATFGAEGSWTGYMDKATKGTLANLAEGKRNPSGTNDDQVPAVARFPAVMLQQGTTDEDIDAVIAVTSVTETAASWGPAAAYLLRSAYDGMSPREAALTASSKMSGDVALALLNAVQSKQKDTVAFAGEVGRACSLAQALPVIFQICAKARTYTDAINRNILAGGDSCGRAPVLGAVFASAYGMGGAGVPEEWVSQLASHADLSAEIAALVKKSP